MSAKTLSNLTGLTYNAGEFGHTTATSGLGFELAPCSRVELECL